jgi:hypothetical protein
MPAELGDRGAVDGGAEPPVGGCGLAGAVPGWRTTWAGVAVPLSPGESVFGAEAADVGDLARVFAVVRGPMPPDGRERRGEGSDPLGDLLLERPGDLDSALEWGRKLARVTTLPIEVRPFQDADED